MTHYTSQDMIYMVCTTDYNIMNIVEWNCYNNIRICHDIALHTIIETI